MKTKGAKRTMNVLAMVGGVLLAVLFVGWLGFQVAPAPFASYPEAGAREFRTVPLPTSLPKPVERFYRLTYGDEVPVVDSVVITGAARIRPFGMWLPGRFRFTHDAGRGYRHYIEATWFGLPLMRVNERYVDGRSLMELPWTTEHGPKVEQAANLGMWAELSSAAPSVLLTDPRVKWEPVDDDTALLRVPLGDSGTDTFVARFDPNTGSIASLEAMRYQESKSSAKILWTALIEPGPKVGAFDLPSTGSATWSTQGAPWAVFTTQDLRYNVDVSAYLRAKGQ